MTVSNTTQPHLSCSRTYRFPRSQACELDKIATLLGITESELVRKLLKQGVEQLCKGRK